MEGINCNGEGGWTRVAFVNMSQPGATCPTGLTQIQQSGLTLCSRDSSNIVQRTFFTTFELEYSEVCGRVQGYQFGLPSGFSLNDNIDEVYTDGTSITHGTNPRQHIWTYAVGRNDDAAESTDCPCSNGSTQNVSSFVGDNYYCESGTNVSQLDVLYPDDPLWDGMQCNNLETTCCTNSRMPWFYRTLGTANGDIELRLLFSSERPLGSPLDLIELYIR